MIYSYASLHRYAIITHDRRFGRIFLESYDKPTTTIVLVVVSPQPEGSNKLLRVALQSNDFEEVKFRDKLVIISVNKIRIRFKYE